MQYLPLPYLQMLVWFLRDKQNILQAAAAVVVTVIIVVVVVVVVVVVEVSGEGFPTMNKHTGSFTSPLHTLAGCQAQNIFATQNG